MRCPKCGHEFANPTAQAGGRAGGQARVPKGFAVAGQPSTAARKRGWKKRKARAKQLPNRRIGKLLKTGNARIAGKVSLGQRWPDDPHAWIIENLTDRTTHHVPVSARPTWERYRKDGRAAKESPQ